MKSKIFLALVILPLAACSGSSGGGAANNVSQISVSSANLAYIELAVTGTHLDQVTAAKVKSSGSETSLTIGSQTSTRLSLKTTTAIALVRNVAYTLLLNEAQAQTAIQFSVGNSELTKCPSGMSLVAGTSTTLAYCIDTKVNGPAPFAQTTSCANCTDAVTLCKSRGLQVCSNAQYSNVYGSASPTLQDCTSASWTNNLMSATTAMLTLSGSSCSAAVGSSATISASNYFRCCTN